MWFLLSFLCAFFTATSVAISKAILERNDEYLVGWLRLVIATPFLLPILLWVKMPILDATFFKAVSLSLPLELIAYLLYIKAIKYSPLSLTLPFLSLTPVSLILSGWVILGESINLAGIIGIAFVAVGTYVLNIERFHLGIWEPLRAIIKQKGSVYMIIVALIYGITSALGKLAATHSSPLFFSAVYNPFLSLFLIPLVIRRYKQGVLNPSLIKKDIGLFLLMGAVFSLSVVTHFAAIVMTNAAYMVAVKRLSAIFGIIYGWLFFHERHILNRLVGTALMVLGVLIISLA